MKENTKDKSLIKVSEKGIFYKIKKFFANIFNSNKNKINEAPKVKSTSDVQTTKKNSFTNGIKISQSTVQREMELLELQKRFRAGKIRVQSLTDSEMNALCQLYDKQIAEIERANQLKRQRILEYKKCIKKK